MAEKKMFPLTLFLLVISSFNNIVYSYSQPDFDTSQNPVNFHNLKHVRIENLQGGDINIYVTRLFENVRSLEILNCNFSVFNYNMFYPLSNLEILKIKNVEKQKEIICNLEERMKNLREFYLDNTAFSPNYATVLGSWSLERLYVNNAPLPRLWTGITVNPALKNITFKACKLETVDEGAFNGLYQLQYLSLRNNLLKQLKKEVLAPLESLKFLDLSGNKLESLCTDQFPPMPNLEIIDVGKNPIKKIDLEGIKKLAPKLKKVGICDIHGVDAKGDGIDFVTQDLEHSHA